MQIFCTTIPKYLNVSAEEFFSGGIFQWRNFSVEDIFSGVEEELFNGGFFSISVIDPSVENLSLEDLSVVDMS